MTMRASVPMIKIDGCLEATFIETRSKNPVVLVTNLDTGKELGMIKYPQGIHKYCFVAYPDIPLDPVKLKAISRFIEKRLKQYLKRDVLERQKNRRIKA
jgi:hypothetical protein